MWKTDDVVHGKAPKVTAKKFIETCASNLKECKRSGALAAISHAPAGVNRIPNKLMRGNGFTEGKGNLHHQK